MAQYLRCENCGYDLYGPEYLANTIDPLHSCNQIFYSTQALLETCTHAYHKIECPHCHTQGHWTH